MKESQEYQLGYDHYVPLEAALKTFIDTCDHHNFVVDALADPKRLQALINILNDAGFRRISPDIKAGEFALVMTANNHQMVRIVSNEHSEKTSVHSPDILQPIAPLENNAGFSIEVLPHVHTLNEILNSTRLQEDFGIHNADKKLRGFITQLIADNFHHGKFFFDPSLRNVGLIKNGQGDLVPIILDRGAVKLMSERTADDAIQFAIRCIDEKLIPNFNYSLGPVAHIISFHCDGDAEKMIPIAKDFIKYFQAQPALAPVDYEQAQNDHLAQRRLKKGHVAGVFTAADLKAVKSNSVTYRMARDGIYPGEIIHAAAAAHDMQVTDSPQDRLGFCKLIEDKRAEYAKERGAKP